MTNCRTERVWNDILRTWPDRPPPPAAPVLRDWPTPETGTQGFLSNRWQRRDGTIYGEPAATGRALVNSPIDGGEDTDASVDVPSGAPRV